LWNVNLANVAEIDGVVPNLVRIPERGAEQTLAAGLKHDNALPLGQDDPPQGYHALVAHGVADDRKRLQRNLVLRNQIIGAVDVALVDLGFRHKAIDVDRVTALDRDGVELFVLDLQVDALIDFVTPPLIVGIDWVARPLIDQLLTKAIAGFLVDLPEGDSLA